MIDGAFGAGFLLPIRGTLLLLSLLGCGLWAETAGGDRARLLLGGLLGLGLGVLAAELAIAVPLPGWVREAAVIVLGALVATALALPALLGAALALVLLFVQGYAGIGGVGLPLLGWVGLACGVVLVTAAGVGLAALARGAVSDRAVRSLGVGMIAIGVLFILRILP